LEIEAAAKMRPNENIFSRQKEIPQIEGLDLEADASLVGVPNPESVAYKSGLRNLDLVLSVNGSKIASYRELELALESSLAKNSQAELEVQSFLNGERGPVRKISLSSSEINLENLGIEFAETYVLKVKDPSPAFAAGLKAGDKIVALRGQP
ncbi:MAG: hypothetical protein GW917_03625, partial [Bdellovibrionales bacterium]|nr:hypothetical protein [Bdellovibrionales bacterium]